MCGIFATLGLCPLSEDTLKKLECFINNRGPDYTSQWLKVVSDGVPDLSFKAAILHQRGLKIQEQPVVNDENNILLFNGHIYEHAHKPLVTQISDTQYLYETLGRSNSLDEIADVLSLINGPFAVIYWNASMKALFYGRDLFGRKSLCTLDSGDIYPIAISSISVQEPELSQYTWSEVDCSAIHCIDFSNTSSIKRIEYCWYVDEIFPRTSKCKIRQVDSKIQIRQLSNIPLKPLNQSLKLRTDFADCHYQFALNGLELRLLESITKRIKYDRLFCLDCRKAKNRDSTCDHTKVAVALSGGIDSTIIALLLSRILDKEQTIDLINVSFKEESPDRDAFGIACQELLKLCPDRSWRLVLCDVDVETLRSKRLSTIKHLIMPCDTVVDDSLGCACWFIGRGQGRARYLGNFNPTCDDRDLKEFLQYKPGVDNSHTDFYKSPACILFAGMSIDEQLGGYSSHRTAWKNNLHSGVIQEISFQMRRLSTRNMGRDDRVFSDHGRDVKLPFLDHDLVSFLNQLPVCLKMDLDEHSNLGPKKLLRDLAKKLGLQETSRQVKRALQFGSRIAKLEESSERGDQICSRLH